MMISLGRCWLRSFHSIFPLVDFLRYRGLELRRLWEVMVGATFWISSVVVLDESGLLMLVRLNGNSSEYKIGRTRYKVKQR